MKHLNQTVGSHLMTVAEAADSMRLGRSNLLKLVYDGAIASVKIGRRRLITPLALDAYIQSLEGHADDPIMKRVVTFWYDDDAGEVSKVDYDKDFIGETSLMRADVLQDCLVELSNVYEKSRTEFEQALMKESENNE